MNNFEKLRYQRRIWKKELNYFKVEVIFLNNLCSQIFKSDVDKFLSELEDMRHSLLEREQALHEDSDFWSEMELEDQLLESVANKKKMEEFGARFKNFRTLCKKMSYQNLAIY